MHAAGEEAGGAEGLSELPLQLRDALQPCDVEEMLASKGVARPLVLECVEALVGREEAQ